MRAARPLMALSVAALALLAGCGGEARDATSKELSALTAEISKLRAEQAAMVERIDALERGKGRAADAAAAPAPAAPRVADAAAPPSPSLDSDRPSLDVVHLGPSDGEGGDGDVDDAGPRTVLRSGANGIVVEEQNGPGATTRSVTPDPAKKPASPAKKADKSDKSDRPDRKKTASLPTP